VSYNYVAITYMHANSKAIATNEKAGYIAMPACMSVFQFQFFQHPLGGLSISQFLCMYSIHIAIDLYVPHAHDSYSCSYSYS